eukprot:gb/GECG01009068.1/.p1 GENE.gb/GECG01009068.1/~~gb/GECG01009068.1/.p1  ORF type:complete len:683 (+),score=58.41 gb/GECG01009068.1/:1-2049(+)
MNTVSSRSHSVFSVQISARLRDRESRINSVINLADLSGSENMTRAGADKERQAEATKINRGLLSLGRVIKALVEGSDYVPYRDSKLTRVLRSSLCGNCLSVMALNVSPCDLDIDETVSTMNYAHMAKEIHTMPRRNYIDDASTGNLDLTEIKEPGEESTENERPEIFVSPVWSGTTPVTFSPLPHVKKPSVPRILQTEARQWANSNFLTAVVTERGGSVLSKQTQQLISTHAATTAWEIFRSFDTERKGILSPREIRSLLHFMRDCIFEYSSDQALTKLIYSPHSTDNFTREQQGTDGNVGDTVHARIQQNRRSQFRNAMKLHTLDALHRLPIMPTRWKGIKSVAKLLHSMKARNGASAQERKEGDTKETHFRRIWEESVNLISKMSKLYAEHSSQFQEQLDACRKLASPSQSTPLIHQMEEDIRILQYAANFAVSLSPEITTPPHHVRLGPGFSLPFPRFLSFLTHVGKERPLFMQLFFRKFQEQRSVTTATQSLQNFGQSSIPKPASKGSTALPTVKSGNMVICQAVLEQLNECRNSAWALAKAKTLNPSISQEKFIEIGEALYHLEVSMKVTLYSFGGCETALRLQLPLSTNLLKLFGAVPHGESDTDEDIRLAHGDMKRLSKAELRLLTEIAMYERPFGNVAKLLSWVLPNNQELTKERKRLVSEFNSLMESERQPER